METIGIRLQEVKRRIAAACVAAGRPANIVTHGGATGRPGAAHSAAEPGVSDALLLLAVSKTFGDDAVRAAFAQGQRAFGENYVQEALAKIEALADLRGGADGGDEAIEWHLIGPLQSNKTRVVAEAFHWVHSVDRLKIAERLAAQRPAGLPPLQLCLQVNISGEASKQGVAPAEAAALAQAVAALPAERVRLRGLMSIPEAATDDAAQRVPHRALHALLHAINAAGLPGGQALDTLSMGMSADLEAAVAEGATVVRVGTAVFGGRGQPGKGSGL